MSYSRWFISGPCVPGLSVTGDRMLSCFHPALHNLSALWALQMLCMCFLAGESHWETSMALAHGVSHGPDTEQKFSCVSLLLPRK